MQDSTLFMVALATALLGCLALFLLTLQDDIAVTPAGMLSRVPDDQYVKIEGDIKKIGVRNNITTIIVEQPVAVEGVFFEPTRLDLVKGDCVRVWGTKTTYQEKTELQIMKIARC